MNELKWEAYVVQGHGKEQANLKNLSKEQRQKLGQRLNEQCAASVVLKARNCKNS